MSTQNTRQSFVTEINSFRGLAIILIVSSHLLYWDIESPFYKTAYLFFSNSTIFFAFISGYLFQYLLKKFSYKTYLFKKVKYVLVPYLIVSIPAIALRLWQGPSYMALYQWPDISEYHKGVQVFYYICTGAHLLPLWYIPMIMLYFIAAPVFKYIDQIPRLYWALIPLLLLSLVYYRTTYNINNIPRMSIHFLSVYLLGMFYSKYQTRVNQKIKPIRFILLLLAVGISVTCLLVSESYLSQLIFIQKILLIPVMLTVLSNSSPVINKVLDQFAQTSFGIYFIHFYVILFVRAVNVKLFGEDYPTTPYYWVVTLIFTLAICWVTVKVIQKIAKVNSRLLIGS